MKKSFLLVLIVLLLIFTFSLYATDPTENFQVETIVGLRQGLKLVDPGTSTPTTVAAFEGLTANNEKVTVTDSNYSSPQTVRKLIAYCNSAAGYDIFLAASAMVCTNNACVIKYTVTAGDASVTTSASGSETEAAKEVVSKTTLSNIDFYGADIIVSVNESDYLNATAGTYTGTIKITVISNS